ncbi:phage baseplate assembly protein V [Niabella ginsengisoli]|uniref:Phage baseplate assembly protein V n=1 Tax=Niabella ginsengisoli TaxID=522298 RepID=A0ABS9SGQ2_9BACT|nr:phage baseplate assembly protein V [Niabella ginsengisoli]MCH5597553.1 phage baseplate assembly protein V [Niabella ginsengisoli]
MLAARYGEWLFYNGTQMIFGNPEGKEITLKIGTDVTDVGVSAKTLKPSEKHAGFNTHDGKEVLKDVNEAHGMSDPFIKAGLEAGQKTYEGQQQYTYANTVFTSNPSSANSMDAVAERLQHGNIANTTYLSARSEKSTLALGTKIYLKDKSDASAGNYIIILINHFCSDQHHYQNSFSAIPQDVKRPPYTNAHLYPVCKPQPAIVLNNEDDKGMGRLQVKFPWQAESKDDKPWLSVMVPHAGKGKGFLFYLKLMNKLWLILLEAMPNALLWLALFILMMGNMKMIIQIIIKKLLELKREGDWRLMMTKESLGFRTIKEMRRGIIFCFKKTKRIMKQRSYQAQMIIIFRL